MVFDGDEGEAPGSLPPPPPLQANVVPLKAELGKFTEHTNIPSKPKRVPMSRPGLGTKGQPVQLLTNHFKVIPSNVDNYFYHYSVSLFYEDARPVDGKGIGRKVIDCVYQTYHTELGGSNFAFDGEKSLFTLGALPQNKHEFTVVLDDITSNRNTGGGSPGGDGSPNEGDRKRMRRPFQSKTFRVEINYAAKIPMKAIGDALRGQDSHQSQEALRVLDIILRQHASRNGCLLVRQSFFHDNFKNFTDIGGGVLGCRGFHSSFRAAQGGLSLNVDVSTTMIVQPGPVVDFLIANQGVRTPFEIDWAKAKRALKNLRVKTSTSKSDNKITGLSEDPCDKQLFSLKRDGEMVEITVHDYFVNIRGIKLGFSAKLPCINIGKPKRPTYLPVELCELVSLQRYTKALSTFQRSALVEKSRQKPKERMAVLNDALATNNYDADQMLKACGIKIDTKFTQVKGRILSAPKLKLGNGEELFPRNGRWNYRNKRLVEPTKVDRWIIVNFSARCDTRKLVTDLIRCGEQMGIFISSENFIIDENPQSRRASPAGRVDAMFEKMKGELPGPPKFILCILQERNIYGPWKKKTLSDLGIVTQCFIAKPRVNDQTLANLLLKINAKLGGLNTMLSIEHALNIPLISKAPTLILGMDVSHGSPGQADVPSVAAVVSSRQWPSISRYRACVRTQSPKVEMVDALYKRVSEKEDAGIIRELLLDFYTSSGKRKPDQIIIFRDGVSESQFSQVLNIELDQIIEACKFLDDKWSPKFTVIIAQKNHHTRFFQPSSDDNVPPGTIIDNQVCHPRNNDFYMCAHAGMIGTTRPTHYHVLYDEIHFSPDDLQELVHSLSYVYQRSSTAISIVAPVAYAHLAATQVTTFMKLEDMSESSSGKGGVTGVGGAPVPELPKLHEKVCSSMFFC
ncbi:hypothetical protein GIB67_010499 [Kingdonia uniflora]|uniref:Argonaute 4 n=1 Tax=Kingdonia uniflora TaxID=39325 RepID=A0A7J7MAK9_9MAGN|nr:hypothetical protein GIB67_010499 [Kingdonia uniflora]